MSGEKKQIREEYENKKKYPQIGRIWFRRKLLRRLQRLETYAATGMGKAVSIIIAVTNKELRDRLSKMNAQVMGSNSDPFYGAPVVLIVLANKNYGTYVYDGSLVMGNLMLVHMS